MVIAGGIDLSVASMMALTSVTAARAMAGASDETAALVVVLVLLLGLALGALNGLLIVVTRVPDIVVTLAMLFVLQGAALLVLPSPGGAAAPWLKALIIGTVAIPGVPDAITAWIPKALVLLLVCLAAVWIPLRRSRLGLSIYAIGSSELAAFRSGVPVARTRIAAYALSGLFAAMGGLSLTMSTGIGAPIPGPYLLASVAAVVLGGVVLGGGRGGLARPDRRRLHPAPRPHRPDAPRRRPQRHLDHRGHDHGRRGDVRRLHRHAGPHAMTMTATPEPPASAAASSASWATTRWCRS